MRKNTVTHKINPFLQQTEASSNIGKKRTSAGKSKMVVDADTGEIENSVTFYQVKEVDKTQFVKLYYSGIKALTGLTLTGFKVFQILSDEIQKNPNKDIVFLSFQAIKLADLPISKATFHRGLSELIERGFIAHTELANHFFINFEYVWNGDRLKFINEYKLKTQ